MRISDWSADVCSSDLLQIGFRGFVAGMTINVGVRERPQPVVDTAVDVQHLHVALEDVDERQEVGALQAVLVEPFGRDVAGCDQRHAEPEQVLEQARSEEHTSELQSLMRISYAVFCLNKK